MSGVKQLELLKYPARQPVFLIKRPQLVAFYPLFIGTRASRREVALRYGLLHAGDD